MYTVLVVRFTVCLQFRLEHCRNLLMPLYPQQHRLQSNTYKCLSPPPTNSAPSHVGARLPWVLPPLRRPSPSQPTNGAADARLTGVAGATDYNSLYSNNSHLKPLFRQSTWYTLLSDVNLMIRGISPALACAHVGPATTPSANSVACVVARGPAFPGVTPTST